MLLQICFQTLHVLGIHSSLEQSLVTRYQKDMRDLRVWLVFWKKKRNRASGIEENYDLGHRHDAQRLCYEGITCQREMVHAGDAVQQQCRGLCPEPFLWLPLAFEKGPDTVSRLGFLAVLLRLYLCGDFCRNKAFVPGSLVVCLYLKTAPCRGVADCSSFLACCLATWEPLVSSSR